MAKVIHEPNKFEVLVRKMIYVDPVVWDKMKDVALRRQVKLTWLLDDAMTRYLELTENYTGQPKKS